MTVRTILGVLVVLIGAFVAINLPDIQRYLKLREM
jgi:hypothetical protein